MYKFVTFALDRVKLSTVHRKRKSTEIGKKGKEKIPRYLGPADTTIHTREDGQQYNHVETVMWHVNGPMVNILWEQKYRGRIGQVEKTLHSWWKEKIASPISKIDDVVKHIFREHNQEADHWVNIGAKGQK